MIAKLCDWINEADFIYGEVSKIGIAIIKAIIAHLYLAWIHPFGDGNGRTARLVEYEILVCSGVPSPAAHLLSNHYNETRSEYYRQLDQASKTGSPIEFFQYALQGFVDGLHAQLDVIKNQQWLVAWENYVHSQFRTRISAVDIRRRNLVLDLSKEIGPVPKSDIRVMTPRLAEAYVGKTLKTITRDINTLADMGLVTKSPQGVEANMGIILAFLPLSGPVVPMNEEENGQLQFTL